MQPIKSKLLIFTTVALTLICFFTKGIDHNTFYGDGFGYYLYLPSAFIYHNLQDPQVMPNKNEIDPGVLWHFGMMERHKTPTGHLLDQYTYGVALMESPFFFIAHLYEKITGGKANGYTSSYQYMVKVSSLMYALLGLVLLYKILRIYFGRSAALLSLLLIYLCTNLFWFSVYQAGMSHVILFFLYTLTIYITIKLYERPKLLIFALLGLTTGLITLIRPVDIICLLIPLLYNVYNRETLKGRLVFIRIHIRYIAWFALLFLLPAIPQLFYWKAVTGHYLVYSYGDQSFNWTNPKIIRGLFYFSNGWLPYSPVMIFSIAGLYFYRKINKWAWCIYFVLPVYIYIIYSWYCYNYINGFGSRPMIHLYPLLAMPLAAFIDFVSRQRMAIKAIFGILILFFLAMNISYSTQETDGILNSDESNLQYNYQIFFHNHLTIPDLITRDLAQLEPDTSKLMPTTTLLQVNYNDSTSDHDVPDNICGDKYVYHMKDSDEYAPIGTVIYNKKVFGKARYFKFSGKFMYTKPPEYWKHQIALERPDHIVRFCKIENKIYDSAKYDAVGLEHFEINKWGTVYFFLAVSGDLKDGDPIKLYIWNLGKTELYMDDMRLELYQYK